MMGSIRNEGRDRRRCFRARLTGTATVRAATRGALCVRALEDLSLGGAHMAGRAPVAVGEPVSASFRIERMRPITSRGLVVRASPTGEQGFAIAFRDLSPRLEDVIHDLIVRSLERDRVPSVLVIDPDARTRDDLARVLRELGYRALPVRTPIEAIGQLNEHGTCIEAALVSDHLTQTSAVEFTSFLHEAFPTIRRVLAFAPGHEADALHAVQSGFADEALPSPWRRAALQHALGPHVPPAPQPIAPAEVSP